MEFQGFPKIPRYSRECIITEKIDGTNGQILIVNSPESAGNLAIARAAYGMEMFDVYAGSRSRWLSLENDNFGFARWVADNAIELLKLGPGRHFGEWWGQGIQRGYGLKEKRFSLFNVKKWGEAYKAMQEGHENSFPKCCHVIPVLWTGPFLSSSIEGTLNCLARHGSYAAPGFMRPEGIIIYHTAGNLLFKKTLENDEKGKGE